MVHVESTEVTNKFTPKELDLFRRDITSFGLEVQKFSRKGSPAARTVQLAADSLELIWVGKGGKRNHIDLNDVVAIRAGVSPENSDLLDDCFPSETFKKHGIPGNGNLYVSLYLGEGDWSGRTTLDIQTATPADTKRLHAVMMAICPKAVANAPRDSFP